MPKDMKPTVNVRCRYWRLWPLLLVTAKPCRNKLVNRSRTWAIYYIPRRIPGCERKLMEW